MILRFAAGPAASIVNCKSAIPFAIYSVTHLARSLFDDPDSEERKLYVQYWQAKLKSNKSVSFPDSLVKEVVDKTDKFSFAYLKEAL